MAAMLNPSAVNPAGGTAECADLEISLLPATGLESPAGEAAPPAGTVYTVEMRLAQPGSDADIHLAGGALAPIPPGGKPPERALARFNLAALRGLALDPQAYGEALTQGLFASEAVRSGYQQARSAAAALGAPLRLRLSISPFAPELHSLYWETLLDPQDARPLARSEQALFSRYLASLDWRPVRPLPRRSGARGGLRALALVANPPELAGLELPEVSAAAELGRLRQGLGDIPLSALFTPGKEPLPGGPPAGPPTVDALAAGLRGPQAPDILCIVAHGQFKDGETWLLLENAQGGLARLAGSELVARLKDLDVRPRLVLLVACQSAGGGAAGSGVVLSALGPRLAEAGIPAVIAMQGNISINSAAEFLPSFFTELQRDGQIDRAMGVARRAITSKLDAWMPALFMRLRSGRLWYNPGFAGGASGSAAEFETWESLKSFIGEHICTPIVGLGLGEPLVGLESDLARNWAEKHGYPLAASDTEDLGRVAQYVLTRQNPTYLRIAYRDALRDELLKRFGHLLPAEITGPPAPPGSPRPPWPAPRLLQAISAAASLHWETDPEAPAAGGKNPSPYDLLARLRLPIYITASPGDLLFQALKRNGADPQMRICLWNSLIPQAKGIYEDQPTPEKPLVYHLFGHLSEPFSLTITEDEYFDFLIGVTKNVNLIPSAVRAALTSTALLFLGFQMDDWRFRVFFRMIMAQEGREGLRRLSHAAAQVEPEDGRMLNTERARRYLEKYFESEKISLFWGNSEDFLQALWEQLALDGVTL
jgi:hypothetical protein